MNNQQFAQGLGLDQNKNKTGGLQDVSKPQKSSAKVEIWNTGPTQLGCHIPTSQPPASKQEVQLTSFRALPELE